MRLTLGVTGFFLSIAFVYGIDLPWVPLEFSFSMHRTDPVEHINDVPTGDLARSYQQAVSVFIMMIGQKYYDKVLDGMDEPKKMATEITEKLINGTSENPNDDLKIINKIALEAVDLIPLNKSMGIELFEIPKPLGPVVVDNSPRTTKQLLMDYPKLMHKDIENVRNFLDQQFIAGWNQARHFYELEVQSMRRHYSKIMLRSLATRFDDIGKNSEIIKSKVSTDVWNEFLRVNSTLQTAFEWVKSL